ncbi:glycoside hydrolase family 25 protein [Aneurinibacillus migulanus]|uniref:glycoside hydrolase family 25 protein n=1 Tax=Aneurinibacillus migulanus TaxID=47500 RepID=UPI0020A0E204|nr:glycoside hydrolase family 25 protein [Aneurinibacillus migulanus]MCP1357402.1 glycoside hydrolase family 25 protein [Aneurinibacillus migulanus]
MTKIKGIDVSHWNGVVDWKKVAADGVKFVFLKASEGTTYVDRTFKTNAVNARANGIHVGAYHYAKFGSVTEAKAEAQHFLRTVSVVKLTYPLVLDLEENKKKASKAVLTDAAIAFLDAIEKAGYFAMIYAGKYFFETQLDEKRLKPYALWIARYNSFLGRDAGVWQYTETGRVSGISGNVDMNWSYVDYATLIAGKKVSAPDTAVGTVTDSKELACHIVVNGAKLDAPGIIRNDLSYLPVRAIGNAVGVVVGLCNGKATLGKGTLETTIVIGEKGYAQAREIAQVLGYNLNWCQKNRQVTLTKGKR